MDDLRCPHCGEELKPFELPDVTGWGAPFHMACFNDECPYYTGSWRWMEERYGVRAGYRYRLDPETGETSPLPVWSPVAIKDRILDVEITRTVVSPVTVEVGP